MTKKIKLTETELTNLIQKMVQRALNENELPVDDINFELSDSEVDDLMSTDGPRRRFRASIYVDGFVPETEDKEYDRKVAEKIMQFYSKQLPIENYVGGVGFKRSSLIDPYDKDF